MNYFISYSVLIIYDVYKFGNYNNVYNKIKVNMFIDNLRDLIIIKIYKV